MLPWVKALNAIQCAAPCMNGGPGIILAAPSGDTVAMISSMDATLLVVELPAAHGADEDVGLPPQDPLGHAGGSAGVEDVQVVGRP